MRTRSLYALLSLLLLTAIVEPAAAIYTPNPAGRWHERTFSLFGDFQFNHKALDPGSFDIDSYGVFIRPSFSPLHNMSVYGRLGFQGADHIDVGFAGGFGIQYAYEFPGNPAWAIGGAFDFVYWSADYEHRDANVKWAEFQFTPAVSYAVPQVPGLVPYAGVMLDFVRGRGDLSEDDPAGLVIGTSWDPHPHVRIDAQFRVIAENGVFVSAGYIF